MSRVMSRVSGIVGQSEHGCKLITSSHIKLNVVAFRIVFILAQCYCVNMFGLLFMDICLRAFGVFTFIFYCGFNGDCWRDREDAGMKWTGVGLVYLQL